MERINFVDGTTLDISAVSNNGKQIVISVQGGDFVELETKFSDKDNLTKLILTDEQGNKMSAFKNYTILSQLTKRKNVVVDDIEDVVADIVDVTLEQEPEWLVSQREQDKRITSVEETTDILVMSELQ